MGLLRTLLTKEIRKGHHLKRLCTLSTNYLPNATSRHNHIFVITDDIRIPHLEISANTAYTGRKENKKKKACFQKAIYI